MKFAIAIPQFYADSEFDPGAFRAYFARAEELGFDSAWTQEAVLGAGPQLSPIETMTYAAACTERMRLGCVVFVSTLHSPVHLAITGTAADCVREVNQVAAAGAELILFTALFEQREQMEQLAAAVLPKLG
jgi:Luciferase-like monooxygenase